MYRYPSEQLMTVAEAERLSELHTGRNRRKQPVRQPSLWVWSCVSRGITPELRSLRLRNPSGTRRTPH